jgi:acyl-coenzyme A synthetase/AMP-(fatty) acid ligase
MEISLGEAIFRFADALPVNASGKILKRELRTRV